MVAAPPPNADALLNDVVTALRKGDVARARRTLAEHPGAVPPESFQRLAELNMRRRRWADAAFLLDQMPARESDADLKRCLCRNLAALERHRPEVYAALVNLPATQSVFIAPAATGRPTIVCRRADGSDVCLSPSNDPVAAMAVTMDKLRPTLERGSALALCGIGDGYVLHALAADKTPLFLGMRQPVFVLEPDAQVVLHALMIHDYTGPDGPIEQERFFWFVGPDWQARFEQAALADPYLGCPNVGIGLSTENAAIQAALKAVGQKILTADTSAQERVEQHYATLSRGELARLFGPAPPRPPRVLLLTTRFSTVLQYSTRDAADAFRRLGWDARVLIEPSPAHRMYQHGMRRTLDEFRPDLVFQIDHLRFEHGHLFPPGLPFACWIQDHLPHLQTPLAGLSVGGREFVLTDAGSYYADRFGYPLPRCIPLAKCAADPGEAEAEVDPAAAEDVVFVSNASRTAEAMLAAVGDTFGGELRDWVEAGARDLLAVYTGGGSAPNYVDVCDVFRGTLARLGANLAEPDFLNATRWLMHPFNDALYRQQALGWAVDAAEQLGLSVGLYGRGWEDHPRFAPHARGPVDYGEPLRRLTRAARINLQIVPYFSLHQRLLDGLLAGGFFLVRRHPCDVAPAALLDFLEAHLPTGVATDEAARRAVPPATRDELEQRLADCRCLSSGSSDDAVALVRSWQANRQLVAGAEPLPRLGEVSFTDADSLRRLMARFTDSPDARRGIVEAQRRSVAERFTYDAGMRRVAEEIGRRLAGGEDEIPVTVHRWG